MRLVLASDTHGMQKAIKFPDGDILILAGDTTVFGTSTEFRKLNSWIETLPYEKVIIIGGNHDVRLVDNPLKVQKILKSSKIYYLQDNGMSIDGLNFYGTPWTRALYFDSGWAFGAQDDIELDSYWNMIPSDIDVLITHSPPHGILDKTTSDQNEGSVSLYLQIINRIKPKIHIFGHIHEASGEIIEKGITFINASVLNEVYGVANQPRVINI